MKPTQPQPRAPQFNRFQTSIAGLRFASTAMDAHFDPYAEPARTPDRSLETMEQVARVKIADH